MWAQLDSCNELTARCAKWCTATWTRGLFNYRALHNTLQFRFRNFLFGCACQSQLWQCHVLGWVNYRTNDDVPVFSLVIAREMQARFKGWAMWFNLTNILTVSGQITVFTSESTQSRIQPAIEVKNKSENPGLNVYSSSDILNCSLWLPNFWVLIQTIGRKWMEYSGDMSFSLVFPA